jgi:hypothetical protein
MSLDLDVAEGIGFGILARCPARARDSHDTSDSLDAKHKLRVS